MAFIKIMNSLKKHTFQQHFRSYSQNEWLTEMTLADSVLKSS